jgi:hypothetical protein
MFSPRVLFSTALAAISVAYPLPASAQDAAGAAQTVKAADVIPRTLRLTIEKGARIAILGGGDAHGADAGAWVV